MGLAVMTLFWGRTEAVSPDEPITLRSGWVLTKAQGSDQDQEEGWCKDYRVRRAQECRAPGEREMKGSIPQSSTGNALILRKIAVESGK